MKYPRAIFGMLALVLLAETSQAQSRDWRTVQNITPGTIISVKARHRHGVICSFDEATEDELVCQPRLLPYLVIPELRFDRRSVREIRLESSDQANACVGGLIGAGAGALVAAVGPSSGTVNRAGGALLLGGIGALVGASFGHFFHILPGKIVYKR